MAALPEITETLYDEAEAAHLGAVLVALARQGEAFAAALRAEDPVAGAVDADALTAALTPLWEASAVAGAAAVFDPLQEEHGEETKRAEVPAEWADVVRRFVEREGGSSIRNVTDTLLKVVREVVVEGVTEGWTPDEMARALEARWAGLADYAARRIVRTEVVRAMNYGGHAGAQSAAERFGLEMEKEWVSATDHRTRRRPRDKYDHVAANGQRVALDDPFRLVGPAGEELLMHPGDASLGASAGNLIQCRCAVRYHVVGTTRPKTWTEARNEAMRARYEAVKGRFSTWVEAVEDVQAHVEGAAALSFETARRICHSRA